MNTSTNYHSNKYWGAPLLSEKHDIKEVDRVFYEVEGSEAVTDIIRTFNLQKTSFASQHEFLMHYTICGQRLWSEPGRGPILPEKDRRYLIDNVVPIAKKMAEHWEDYECYFSGAFHGSAVITVVAHREDGTTPYIRFWKHALRAERWVSEKEKGQVSQSIQEIVLDAVSGTMVWRFLLWPIIAGVGICLLLYAIEALGVWDLPHP